MPSFILSTDFTFTSKHHERNCGWSARRCGDMSWLPRGYKYHSCNIKAIWAAAGSEVNWGEAGKTRGTRFSVRHVCTEALQQTK